VFYENRHKKGFLFLVLAVLATGGVFVQNRETLNPASDFRFDAATGTITKYVGRNSRVIFPAAINGKPVTAIGEDAFRENKIITEVVINDRIRTIGDAAFYESTLRWIRIDGTSLTSIGAAAFGITLLQSFPGNWPSGIKIIPVGLFQSTPLEGALVIPEGVTEIGDGAFASTKIRSLTLPSTIKKIGQWAFVGCASLTTVTIPSSVRSITFGDEAFGGTTALNAANKKALTDRGYKF
jgi:hypothetical protein